MKMETPKVSRMWSDLQKVRSRLHDSCVLSSCEAEVQELMRQVDLMVEARKQEWLKEKRALQAKLDIREQEAIIQKATLAQKHNEIGQLRVSLETLEQCQLDTKAKYEIDLANLKEQVSQMKHDYDKLQRRYLRHHHDRRKDLDDPESKKLNAKLEEYQRKASEWDLERQALGQQVEALQTQNRILAEKCELVAQSSSELRSQLERRREVLDGSEQGLKLQVTQLSSMLERSKDTISSQDIQLNRLKVALEDACAAQRHALHEKEQVEAALRDAHQRIRKMEDDALELRLSCETNQKMAVSLKDEQSQSNQHLLQVQLALQEKESIIQMYHKTEQHLQEEIKQLRQTLDTVCAERDLLNKNGVRSQDADNSLANHLRNNYAKELESIKQSHNAELSHLRQCESQLRDQLNEANCLITNQKTRTAELERFVDELRRTIDRQNAEIQVVSAQLHASRVENRHLRRVVSPSNMTELQLHELQDAYARSLDVLEEQNGSLKESVDRLEDRIKSLNHYGDHKKEMEKRIAALEAELCIKEQQLQKMCRANEAMNGFVNGVDHIVQTPCLSTPCSSVRYSVQRPCPGDGETETFLAQQDERSRELEDILNQHIDELRAMTDATIKKYACMA